MNFEDLKEQILENLQNTWQNIQESSAYLSLKEKFDDLNPKVQKIIIFAFVGLVLVVIVSIPLQQLTSKSEQLTYFEEERDLTRDLLRLNQEMATAPQVSVGAEPETMIQQANAILAGVGVPKEQIRAVEALPGSYNIDGSKMVPRNINQKGIRAQLAQLNLNQIVNIAYRFHNNIRGAKLTVMDMKASDKDPHYYDVIFNMVSFHSNIKEEEPKKNNKRGRRKRRGS